MAKRARGEPSARGQHQERDYVAQLLHHRSGDRGARGDRLAAVQEPDADRLARAGGEQVVAGAEGEAVAVEPADGDAPSGREELAQAQHAGADVEQVRGRGGEEQQGRG
jgi:hypothetical protein